MTSNFAPMTPEELLRADPRLRIKTIRASLMPNQTSWYGMHQDYSSEPVIDVVEPPPEDEAGRILIKYLVASDRGHYGPLEHPQITIGTAYFPHSVMQQLRTHRISVSFDVQSFRYTSDNLVKAAKGDLPMDEVAYLRPPGIYMNRQGARFEYTDAHRRADLNLCFQLVCRYHSLLSEGCPEEQARSVLMFDYRQHFVVSFNLRSLMHTLDLRAKADAQLEIQALSELLMREFKKWTPEVAQWYRQKRFGKARLAP